MLQHDATSLMILKFLIKLGNMHTKVVLRDGAEQLLVVCILQCCSNLSTVSRSSTNILGVFIGPLSMKYPSSRIENQTEISVKHISSWKVENLLHKVRFSSFRTFSAIQILLQFQNMY
ncbi:hypothetical protein VPH35_042845 [Triticum aestivum]